MALETLHGERTTAIVAAGMAKLRKSGVDFLLIPSSIYYMIQVGQDNTIKSFCYLLANDLMPRI